MKARNLILLGSGIVIMLLALTTGEVRAQDTVQVVNLRTDRVALYDKPNGAKVGEIARDKFKGPWRVLTTSSEGFLQVEVEGKTYWVRPYAVETNRPVRASADCGGVVAAREPKAVPLGTPCHDGQGSAGIVVAPPLSGPGAPPPIDRAQGAPPPIGGGP